MDIQLLRKRAHDLYESQRLLFEQVDRQLGLSKKDIIEEFVLYNSEVETLDNMAYEKPAIRAAMYMEYTLSGSWHQERQDVICRFLNECQPRRIIDIGFGAPMKYMKEYVLSKGNNTPCHLTLAEKFESAFDFAKIVLSHWDINYPEKIDFRHVDLEAIAPIGNYDAYILQDAIEHAPQPTECLSSLVAGAPANAKFLLSLPIGPPIPCHYIYWTDENDAIAWLNDCGLEVNSLERVFVNREVDWFAENLDGIYNLMAMATPIISTRGN